MKTSSLVLAGLLAWSAALPALSAPDWHVIEQSRKAKQSEAEAQAQVQVQVQVQAQPPEVRERPVPAVVTRADGTVVKCPLEPLVLPLDHGFRAVTTPDQNRLLRERYEAEAKACPRTGK